MIKKCLHLGSRECLIDLPFEVLSKAISSVLSKDSGDFARGCQKGLRGISLLIPILWERREWNWLSLKPILMYFMFPIIAEVTFAHTVYFRATRGSLCIQFRCNNIELHFLHLCYFSCCGKDIKKERNSYLEWDYGNTINFKALGSIFMFCSST